MNRLAWLWPRFYGGRTDWSVTHANRCERCLGHGASPFRPFYTQLMTLNLCDVCTERLFFKLTDAQWRSGLGADWRTLDALLGPE